ncbi:hypothetical protein SNE40_018465 [Patella caerulea]|uniref:Uncharacterized protein n=1 Tax=Patella caerulea TaxID=87958 RepID=A0AAN8P800_PATCE
MLFQISDQYQYPLKKERKRSDDRNIYRLQDKDRKLPIPAAFFSDGEKDAYRKNRLVETRLHSDLLNLTHQQTLVEKSIRVDASKFKMDKSSFIQSYLIHKYETMKRNYYMRKLPDSSSEKRRKVSVVLHRASVKDHPVNGIKTSDVYRPASAMSVNQSSMSKIKFLRPHTTTPRHSLERSSYRSKSADTRADTGTLAIEARSPRQNSHVFYQPLNDLNTHRTNDSQSHKDCLESEDDVFKMFTDAEIRHTTKTYNRHLLRQELLRYRNSQTKINKYIAEIKGCRG